MAACTKGHVLKCIAEKRIEAKAGAPWLLRWVELWQEKQTLLLSVALLHEKVILGFAFSAEEYIDSHEILHASSILAPSSI